MFSSISMYRHFSYQDPTRPLRCAQDMMNMKRKAQVIPLMPTTYLKTKNKQKPTGYTWGVFTPV